MKTRAILFVGFSIIAAQAAFGVTLSNCVNTKPPVLDSGIEWESYSCNFYQEPALLDTPFSLLPVLTFGGTYTDNANLAANDLTPGYVVFTTDTGNVTDTAAWRDVLFFVPDAFGGFLSDEIDLYWSPSDPQYPSLATVENFDGGAAQVPLVQAGTSFTFFGGDATNLISFTIVPEPSTFLMVFSAGAAILALRRRKRS